MTIFLSHESALRYWLTCDDPGLIMSQDGSNNLLFASTNKREVKRASLPFEYDTTRKLHVLGADLNASRNKTAIAAHRWTGALGPGCFYQYSDLCQISSPEFTFLQLAGSRDLIDLIELGTYLCAGFSVKDGRGFNELREPVTTTSKLESFVCSKTGSYGAKKAREALRFIVPNTASPMEVLLCLAFSLPPRLGGWGYPELRANYAVDVPPHLRGMLGYRQLRCDIYFPSVNGDVEFDGSAYHSGEEKLDYTQTRRNVLEAMGIKTVSATKRQINTYERFNDFMWMSIEHLGLPMRIYKPEQIRRQQNLYHRLSGYHALF